VAPVYNWTGFYIFGGAVAGVGLADFSRNNVDRPSDFQNK